MFRTFATLLLTPLHWHLNACICLLCSGLAGWRLPPCSHHQRSLWHCSHHLVCRQQHLPGQVGGVCVCVCLSVCCEWRGGGGGGGLQKIMMPTEAPEKQPNETHHKRQISQPVYAPSHIYFQRSRAESGSATWKPFMASFALQKPCCFMLYLFKQSCFRRKSKSAG